MNSVEYLITYTLFSRLRLSITVYITAYIGSLSGLLAAKALHVVIIRAQDLSGITFPIDLFHIRCSVSSRR